LIAEPPPSVSAAPYAATPRLRVLRWALAPAAGPTLAVVIALALTATAFVADGGLRLVPTTRVSIAWMLAGGALAAAAVLRSARPVPIRLHGAAMLAATGALVLVTAVSIVWSVAPSTSWEETTRTLGYFGVVLAGVAMARIVPWRWGTLLQGVGLAAVMVCGWALLTKVAPASLAADETYARLREPFGYWNAVGGMAALGMPALLWLAARRNGHAAANALAWPGMAVLLVALMLSYSRGALLALVVGLALWFLITPVRLRGALALASAGLGTAAIVAWTFSQQALTADDVPLDTRVDAGRELGLLVLLVLLCLLVAGLVAGFAADRGPLAERRRRQIGRALIGGLALLPVIAILAIATAPGGIDGQVSQTVDELSDPEARTPANTPDRLTEASSVRARYWREALAIHSSSPWIGVGAGGYVTARTRVRTGPLLEVRHAHGYVVQTLSDFGWLGVAVSLLALGAWAWSVVRTVGLRRRERRLAWDAERVGMATMAAVGVVYGVHSALDFSWFIPGLTVPALLCAGWLAGALPLRLRLDERTATASSAAEPDRVGARGRARWRLAAAAGILAVAVAAAWASVQPVRSVNASDAAILRAEEGDLDNAAAIAVIASERNPLAVEPKWDLAAIELARNRPMAARAALEQAVRLEPANAETWRRLGGFRLRVAGDPRGALEAFRAAYYLDPEAPRSTSDVLEARRALAARDADADADADAG
jgi:tetratricopeptide (TPR) repeat protein